MKKIKLVIEYDGTAYQGWQSQRKGAGATIQEVIEDRLKTILGDFDFHSLVSAGRTDAGVHALGQVACFKTGSDLPADVIQKALNSTLPHDIRITSSSEVEEKFDPRRDARKKTYFYLIALMASAPVFLRRYVWRVPGALDVRAMQKSLRHFKGKKNFSSFRAAGCSAKTPEKEIFSISVEELAGMEFAASRFEGKFLKISITADSFLRHMARNIVGTLVEVGKGRMRAEDVPEVIACRDRRKSGPTAPARGLFLEKVFY